MDKKIFISYNHNDKQIIDTIVRRLEIEFGRSNIFYDAWSINPGDSIIGKMDDGLSEFNVFFFFISEYSINSNMVRLEWQTALNRTVNHDLNFIGIKVDECVLPTILSDKLYIDLYNEGIDSTIEKMKNVLNNESSYHPQLDFDNLIAYVNQISNNEIKIDICAKKFVEHDLHIAIGFDVGFEDIEYEKHFENIIISGKNCIEMVEDRKKYNCFTYNLQRVLKPGYPFSLNIKSKTPFKELAIFKEQSHVGKKIEYKIINTQSTNSI